MKVNRQEQTTPQDMTTMSFIQLQQLSKETIQQEDLAVLVVERESQFKISIAKTEQAIAQKTKAFMDGLRTGNPTTIVELADEIESLKRGLALLEKFYKILFPA